MFRFAVVRVVCLAAVLCGGAGAQAATSYRITDLGDLPGGINYSRASGINELGQVVGDSHAAIDARAFVWSASGDMQDLGTLPGGRNLSRAYGINDLGQVVGYSTAPSGDRAFLWSAGGGMQNLGDLPGGSNYSRAYGINNLGQVVGYSGATTGDQAFVWSASGGMQDLSGDGNHSYAYGINNLGQVVGVSDATGGNRAFLWSASGGMQNLGELPGGSNFSRASGINDLGQVVGYSSATTGHRAFLWSASGGMQDLGDLPGGSNYSYANGINDLGQVVGYSSATTGDRAFLWSASEGMQSLEDLIAADDPLKGIFSLSQATDINDAGQIVGHGTINGVTHAFLLTAVPETHALLLVLAGLLPVGLRRLRAACSPSQSTHLVSGGPRLATAHSEPLHAMFSFFPAAARLFGLALCTALVVSCGGGSSAGSGATTSNNTNNSNGNTPASDHWVAGTATSPSGKVFYAIDPANPTTPRYSRTLTGSTTTWVLSSGETTGAGSLITPYGAVSFLENGSVEYMSLARSATLAPARLSTAGNVCNLLGAGRTTVGSSSAEMAWVSRSSNCASLSGLNYTHLPSTLTATDPAPSGWAVSTTAPTPLFDRNSVRYLVLYMQAGTSGWDLATYDMLGARLGTAANGNGFASARWGSLGQEGTANTALAYFGTGAGATLRRLSWTGTTANVGSTTLHTFSGSYLGAASSSAGTYFADGLNIHAVAHGGSAATLVASASATGFSLIPTASRVAAYYARPGSCPGTRMCVKLETAPASGGPITAYTFEGTSTTAPSVHRALYDSDQLLLVTPTDAGLHDLALFNTSTGSLGTIASGVRYMGWTLRFGTQRGAYDWGTKAVLYCVPASGGTSCAGRALLQHDHGSSSTINLGSLPSTLTTHDELAPYEGLTSAINLTVNANAGRDLYIVTPGTADSLKFVAAHPQ